MDQLRRYGQSENPSLRYLDPSFAAAYCKAIRVRQRKPVVVCCLKSGERVEKDGDEFDRDVQSARVRLQGSHEIISTIAGNTYEHLVYIVACFLEEKTLCPINPQDGEVGIARKLAQVNAPVTVLRQAQMTLEPTKEFLPLNLDPYQNPMVLIFTSGSTGVSKIVEQDELAILSNVDAMIERHQLQRPTVIATPLPIFHVNALEFSFLASLLSGNTLVLYEQFHLKQIVDSIVRDRVDILSIVPHLLKILFQRCRDGELNRLLYITTAAAPLPAPLAQEIVKNFPVRVLQGYGLSEAVNFSTLIPADLSNEEYRHWMGSGMASIGTEVYGNSVHVMNEQGQELGEGEIGEICVRGWNVMRGYRDDKNLDVFANDSLHTGDLGFFKRDEKNRRFFFITGRKKDAIKRNAMTIPLADVDQALTEMSIDAISVGFQHDIAGEELALVIQSQSAPDEGTVQKIQRVLEKNLAPNLRPHVLGWTSQSIRTPSGKPQRWRFSPAFKNVGSMILTNELHIIESELS